MTKHEFAQELVLRIFIAKGTNLSHTTVPMETLTAMQRTAQGAMKLADAIQEIIPDFFTQSEEEARKSFDK